MSASSQSASFHVPSVHEDDADDAILDSVSTQLASAGRGKVRESLDSRIERLEHPHRDADILRTLYIERGLSTWDIADELDCSQTSVLRWMDRHNVDTRTSAGVEAAADANRVERASFFTVDSADRHGYERWASWHDGSATEVSVHSLVAIADGANPHEVFEDGNDVHTHHSTDIPFLNIAEYVEVVSNSEHQQIHAEADGYEYDDRGFPVIESEVNNDN